MTLLSYNINDITHGVELQSIFKLDIELVLNRIFNVDQIITLNKAGAGE